MEEAEPGGKARNEWETRLNDEVPTDLVVQMGAGESDLDLDSLTLTRLKLQMGAGKATVNLTGDYAKGFDARAESVLSARQRTQRYAGCVIIPWR